MHSDFVAMRRTDECATKRVFGYSTLFFDTGKFLVFSFLPGDKINLIPLAGFESCLPNLQVSFTGFLSILPTDYGVLLRL